MTHPRSPARRRVAATLALVAVLGGASLATACSSGGAGKPVRVVVPAGASFREAADSLESRGVVRSARLFRAYAKLRRYDRSIKPGTYQFAPGMSWSEIVTAMREGRGIVRVVTLPEGWDLRQIVPQLARVLGVPPDSVTAAVRDTALLHRLDIPSGTLEGYLFPATYTFQEGTTPRAAIAQMVARFEAAWRPEWDARLQALALSRHDAVTLASIVEAEARHPEERPVIAAVYLNRLRKGMRLQADPTVQYALPKRTPRVLYKDLEIDSPYNTYRRAGLPPGPIGSPGAPSLEASLHPANVPYLFFVAHPDGHHEFRTTFEEHAQAIREVRRLAQESAGGAPPATTRGRSRR